MPANSVWSIVWLTSSKLHPFRKSTSATAAIMPGLSWPRTETIIFFIAGSSSAKEANSRMKAKRFHGFSGVDHMKRKSRVDYDIVSRFRLFGQEQKGGLSQRVPQSAPLQPRHRSARFHPEWQGTLKLPFSKTFPGAIEPRSCCSTIHCGPPLCLRYQPLAQS